MFAYSIAHYDYLQRIEQASSYCTKLFTLIDQFNLRKDCTIPTRSQDHSLSLYHSDFSPHKYYFGHNSQSLFRTQYKQDCIQFEGSKFESIESKFNLVFDFRERAPLGLAKVR